MPGSRLSVSVVIPCFNVEEYIGECIASVLAQTRPPLNIICVDDGSTDGTLPTLREIEASPHRCLHVTSGGNKGAPAARNRGMQAARGEYIQFLDADDLLHPTKLEHQAGLIRRAEPRPDLVAAAYRKEYLDGPEDTIDVEAEDAWIGLIGKRLGSTCSNLWRKDLVESVGGWDETLPSSQDADLMFRLLQVGAIVVVDAAPLTTIRQRKGSISTSQKGGWLQEKEARYHHLRGQIITYLLEQNMLTSRRRSLGLYPIFEELRLLYAFDRRAAQRLHDQIMPPDFVPRVGFNSPLYVLCYRLFGFNMAQQIKDLFSRIQFS